MGLTILDGSVGQELVKRSTEGPTGLWSTEILIKNPNLVLDVHSDYFAVGADIATTNSYAVHRDRLVRFGIEEKFEISNWHFFWFFIEFLRQNLRV